MHISPESVQEFMDLLAAIIMEEVRDEDTQKRIVRQILRLAADIESGKAEHASVEPGNRPMSIRPKRSA